MLRVDQGNGKTDLDPLFFKRINKTVNKEG